MTVRYMRKTAILARLETAYGAGGSGSWAASDALLVRNAKFSIARDTEPRELVRPWLGGSEHLVAARRAEMEFEIEMVGSGTPGIAPAWGKLLRGSGMSENIVTDTRVEYLPVSSAFESLQFAFEIDGVAYVSRGARAAPKLTMNAYKIPVLKFTAKGFDTNAIEGGLGATYAAWQRPVVLSDAAAGDIRTGCNYVGGAITGGTLLPSRGLEIDLGNKLSHIKLLKGEAIDIVERDVSGSMSVALDAADELTWRDEINNNVLTSVGFNYGTVAGQKVGIYCPSVQRVDPQTEDFEGRALMKTELRILPQAGNDELRIIVA